MSYEDAINAIPWLLGVAYVMIRVCDHLQAMLDAKRERERLAEKWRPQ